MIEKTRNFCIIAHIDHGKSTLADRILELTGAVSRRDLREQFLDDNVIERERGITIKAKAVALEHDGVQFNLIDTPGHVDFTYEVSRSLAACEGAVLLVDATQGVQAETVANALLALEGNLDILPVVNKIDLPTAQVDETIQQMENTLGIKPEEVLQLSAKDGTGVGALLKAIPERISAPKGHADAPLRALIFDSEYNAYRGVIAYVRVFNGRMKKRDRILLLGADREYEIEEVGIFRPKMEPVPELSAGAVGYVIAGIKSIKDVRVGDTIARGGDTAVRPLPGYREPLPVVFSGFFPTGDSRYEDLRRALDRLALNDPSFRYQPETSVALGFGFRCGFLGLLHMEIIQERLEREENTDLIQTAPNVTYEIVVDRGTGPEVRRIDNPAKLPEEQHIREWREPIVRASLIVPASSIGTIMKMCEERRGTYLKTEYISTDRVILHYRLPFAEVVYDFYDRLKAATRGYGTLNYLFEGYRPSDLVKLHILVAGNEVDALSTIVHVGVAERKGREIIRLLSESIPRHMFQIALQASIGKRIVAREDIKALSKNVTAKCYGGDVSRKRKLLEKQKAGKRRMKSVGQVEIPQEAFLSVLRAKREKE